MFDVISNNGQYSARVESINSHAKPQLKVKIAVVGQSNISEYQGKEFDIIEQFA